MLELLTNSPRVVVGAVVGFFVGLAGAYALHSLLPGTSSVASAAVAAAGLALGVLVGAKLEASRS